MIVANGHAEGPSGGTTGTLNTSGATFGVAFVAEQTSPGAAVTDSKSNTWVAGTPQTVSAPHGTIFYTINPTVGTGHTVTVSGSFSAMAVQFHSGIATVSPLDQQNGTGGAAFTSANAQPGSITPTEDNELIVCGMATGASVTFSINESMTITDDVTFAGGNNYAGVAAYKYQTTAAAINPLWSFSGTIAGNICIASFKAGVAAGGAPGKRRRSNLYHLRR